MATPVRYFEKDGIYHIFNRGARKQTIFLERRDYKRFLERVATYKKEYGVDVLAYCLMPNHYHFLLKQISDMPLSTFMLHLGTSYAKYFNLKYSEIGSPFQGRFRAKQVHTDEYLLQVSRYIHRNPKEILLLTPGVTLETYPWSSYSLYLSPQMDKLVNQEFVLSNFASNNPSEDYRQFTEHEITEDVQAIIEDFTSLRPQGLRKS